jgi:hypothetical protein
MSNAMRSFSSIKSSFLLNQIIHSLAFSSSSASFSTLDHAQQAATDLATAPLHSGEELLLLRAKLQLLAKLQ